MRPSPQRATGLATVLRNVVAEMQQASRADIVSIFLYEEASGRYFAPFAVGQPQESLLDSLTDMSEQLGRYTSDAAGGKAPEVLGVHNYGSTVWLTVTRQRLVSRDAPSQIDSTFIRRYQVQTTIGLPLMIGDRLLGLVYLNYRTRTNDPDDTKVDELERLAEKAAREIDAALASLLSEPAGDARTDLKELRRVLSIALADLLLASELDAAAIYQFAPHRTSLELVTAHAPVAAPVRVERSGHDSWESALSSAVASVTSSADLHPIATYALGSTREPHGYLIVMSRDRLATVRRAPATDVLLRAGAELIGGALASQRLIDGLEHSNRLLGALGDMTSAMLRPGASRKEVIEAVVGHLTDASVPEFDFNFATVYLLEEGADGSSVVRLAAGAATAAAIEATDSSAAPGGHGGKRIPRWALEEDRELAPDDVLVYVARTWRTVIVGPMPKGGSPDRGDVFTGNIPGTSGWTEVPVVRSTGGVIGHVLVCVLGEGANLLDPSSPPFTLAGEVFESGGHAELIRIFLPFGMGARSHATGVLEVGYHRSYERRPDWGQVEALRAAAGQVASAVETARLY